MKLSQALMVSLCCFGIAGCSGISSRSTANVPAPALRAAGPDQFAAPPPPPSVPQSTITVAPQKMYNMGAPKKKATAPAPARAERPSAPAETEQAPVAPEKPVKEEGASLAPAAAPAADPAAVARPVRKSEKSEEAAPQSSLKKDATKTAPVDVLPVSQPPVEKKIDTRMSS